MLLLSYLRSFYWFFWLKKTWEIQFLRGKPYFFKINKYPFARWRTCYGVTVVKGPPTKYSGCQIGAGAALPCNFFPHPGLFWTRLKIVARPAQLRKKQCPCILEGGLTTNSILSALHLQGLKSNIHVHFHLVNKPLIGISFHKWNHQWRS